MLMRWEAANKDKLQHVCDLPSHMVLTFFTSEDGHCEADRELDP